MKPKELRELNVEDLNKKAADLRRELFKLRLAKANQQLKNPLQLRHLRRDIARIMTIITEKGAN
ncbi:MAG: 50S ribosomal protein L29 [bacterium]